MTVVSVRNCLVLGLLGIACSPSLAAAQTAVRTQFEAPAQAYGAPGGDSVTGMRVGRPYYWSAPPAAAAPGNYEGGAVYVPGPMGSGGGDPYTYHFGPGYYRHTDYGHYRFPFHSYRSPWYFPGHTSYNRSTNYPW